MQTVKTPTTAEYHALKAAARKELDGPFVPFDADAIYKRYTEKYGFSDIPHLSKEELAEAADRTITEMEPELRAELEREGFL